MKLISILRGLSEIIFPSRCISCETLLDHCKNYSFCLNCFSKIKFIKSPICDCCGTPFAGDNCRDHLCGDCILSKPSYSIARSVGYYESPLLDIVHRFKYGKKVSLGKSLGKLMADYEYPGFSISGHTLIIPVPLHSRRLRERGFNQSVILGREISKRFAIPMDFQTLRRHIYTEPQVSLGKKERESNVRGAFSISEPLKIKDKKIILLDDIYTTGSTVKECSELLLKSGAHSVDVLTLSRAA